MYTACNFAGSIQAGYCLAQGVEHLSLVVNLQSSHGVMDDRFDGYHIVGCLRQRTWHVNLLSAKILVLARLLILIICSNRLLQYVWFNIYLFRQLFKILCFDKNTLLCIEIDGLQ